MIQALPATIGRALGAFLHPWWLAVRRTLVSDLHRIRATKRERSQALPAAPQALGVDGGAHAQVVDYLVWRRGVITVAAVVLGVTAVINVVTARADAQDGGWTILHIVAPMVATLLAATAASTWTRLPASRALAVASMIAFLAVPFAVAVLVQPPLAPYFLAAQLLAVGPGCMRALTAAKTAFPARAHAGSALQACALASTAAMGLAVLWASHATAADGGSRFAVVCCAALVLAPWLQGASAGPVLEQPHLDTSFASHAVRRGRSLARPFWVVGLAGMVAVLGTGLYPGDIFLVACQFGATALLATCVTADATARRLTREWNETAEGLATTFGQEHRAQLRVLEMFDSPH